jgi:DNA-binding IclR family transcriptional regulator
LIQSLSFDPPQLDDDVARAVRLISVPVHTQDNRIALALTLHDFPRPRSLAHVEQLAQGLRHCAESIAARLTSS